MDKDEYRRVFEHEDRLWWFVGMRAISTALLDRFLPRSKNLSVLDAGCGTGGMSRHLNQWGSTVGIDLSPEALQFARLRKEIRLTRASLSQLPFFDAAFDLVTSFDVIYHRGVSDDEQALSEMARVLRPNGYLLIRVPAYNRLRSRHDDAVHTRHRYVRKELDQKLRRNGFVPIFLSYANCFLLPFAVTKRLSEKWFHLQCGGSEIRSIPPSFNNLFSAVLRLEAGILKRARLPVGLSLLAVARRGGSSESL